MADRSFGVREINIVGSAGTPTISSPNNINLNGNNVAISTDLQVGRNVSVVGIVTAGSFIGDGSGLTNLPGGGGGITTANISADTLQVAGVSTFTGDVVLVSDLVIGAPSAGNANLAIVNTNSASFSIGQNTDGSGSNHLGIYYGTGLGSPAGADIFTSNGNMSFWVDGAGGSGSQIEFGNGFGSGAGGATWMTVSSDGAIVSGIVTASNFVGDGSLLTNLPGGGGGSTVGIDTVGTSFFNTLHATGTIDIGTSNAGVAVTHMSIDSADISGTIRNSIKSGVGNTNSVLDISTKEFLVTDPYSGKGAMISADASGTKLYKDDSVKLQTLGAGVTVTGTMYATAFSGDGSALTGVPISGSSGSFVDLDAQSLVVSGISTFNNDIKLALNVLNFGDNSSYLRSYISSGDSYLVSTGVRYDRASDFTFTNAAGSENFAVFVGDGTTATGVDLYGSNGVKLTTVGYGVSITGTTNTDDLVVSGIGTFQTLEIPYDNAKLKIGVGSDIQIYHTGTASIYWDQYGVTKHHGSGWTWKNLADDKTAIDIQVNAGQKLYYDATRRFMTTNDGVHVAGIMTATSVSIGGTSAEPNLTITSDGTDSFIKELNSTGELTISTNQLKIENPSFETLARFNENSDVKLYYDNAEKFATTGSGVNVSGIITATSFSGNSIVGDGSDRGFTTKYYVTSNGSSSYRFAGPGVLNTTDDPTLYFHRGFTYILENSTGGSHPFELRVSDGGAAYAPGGSFLSGSITGTQVLTVPFDAPSSIVYQCTAHSGMVGTINFVS
jgi:hypothetical protein